VTSSIDPPPEKIQPDAKSGLGIKRKVAPKKISFLGL
jgi:hypothetical protein